MHTKMRLPSMIFFCLNSIIGSGLFLLPGQVAETVGHWGLVVYLLVALIVMAIGWCYIQCASHFTKNGGAYLYAKEAFGNFVGFEIGVMRWVVGMIAWAALTSGFVVALGSLFPVVLEAPLKQILIIGIIATLSVVNIFGTKVVERFSNIITFVKVALLLFFVLYGLFHLESHHVSFFDNFFPFPAPSTSHFGTAALIIFFAFSGFETLTVVAAEMENPRKNIPLAIVTAVIFSSLIYFVIQLICISFLGDSLQQSASPIADVAAFFFGAKGKYIVSLAMLLSIGGVIIISSFVTPRSCQIMAEDQLLFSHLVNQNRFGAPYLAVIFSGVIVCVIALSGSFVELVSMSVVSRFAQHSTTCLALFQMEKKGITKPFSHPWKKSIPILALLGIFLLLVYAEHYQIIFGLGALALGVPVYLIQKQLQERRKIQHQHTAA